MFKNNLLIISALVLLFLPSFAFAINVPGWPLVPCGLSKDNPATPNINESKPCGQCDLFQLLKNIIDFVIGGLMPPVAVLFFVWAGFLILLSGANPGLVSQGKTVFSTTFYGIIIMLSSWMITNTLILSVGSKYNNAQNWWQFTCIGAASVSPPTTSTPTTPGGSTPSACSNPQQLASQNNVPFPSGFPETKGVNSSDLNSLIACVNSRIGGLIDQNQIYTYEQNNPLCNLTRGQPVCGSCVHSPFSCHYGSKDGTQGSLAVDFNAKNGDESQLFNELKKLEQVCSFGFIQLETTHTHISVKSCSGN